MTNFVRTIFADTFMIGANITFVDNTAALCTQYSGQDTSPAKDVAIASAHRMMPNSIEKAPGEKSCKPSKIKCNLVGGEGALTETTIGKKVLQPLRHAIQILSKPKT